MGEVGVGVGGCVSACLSLPVCLSVCLSIIKRMFTLFVQKTEERLMRDHRAEDLLLKVKINNYSPTSSALQDYHTPPQRCSTS